MAKRIDSVAKIFCDRLLEIAQDENKMIWCKSWRQAGINYYTGKRYRGVNLFMLADGEFMTMKQLASYNSENDTSFRVKKGSKSYMVIYKSKYARVLPDEDQDSLNSGELPSKYLDKSPYMNEKGKWCVDTWFYKYSKVFNIRDIEDENGNTPKSKIQEIEFVEKKEAQSVADTYCDREGIAVYNNSVKGCYYAPKTDSIHTVPKELFKKVEEYYRTLFHEMTHSTGITTRLNRACMRKYKEKDNSRNKEELVAEIGACILATEVGYDLENKNSEAYIHSWTDFIRATAEKNPSAILSAFSQADKAANFILFGKEQDENKGGAVNG